MPLEGRSGETDGRGVIRLDHRLLQVERRCTLMHELIHLERGHEGACSDAVEREVDREVARRLVPFDALLEAARWARDANELAEELWVTPTVLAARFETLAPRETAEIVAAVMDARGL